MPECRALSARCLWRGGTEVVNATAPCYGLVGACSNVTFTTGPKLCFNIIDMCQQLFMSDINFNKICFNIFQGNNSKRGMGISDPTSYPFVILFSAAIFVYLYVFSATYDSYITRDDELLRISRRRLPRLKDSNKQNQIDELNQKIKDLGGEPMETPSEFDCPITFQVMSKPVILTSGNTFELQAILIHFRRWGFVCPLTRLNVEPHILEPNESLVKEIEKWMGRQQEYYNYLKDDPAETIVDMPAQTVFYDNNTDNDISHLPHRV